MGGSIWEVVGGKTKDSSGGITVRTGKDLKSPESPDGRLSHGALVAELELDGERMRFTRLTGEGPNDGWVSLSFKNRPLVVRSGDIGSKVAEDAAEVERLKANGGVMQPKPGCHKLWILAQGSRGDVQPALALAVTGRKVGWAVRFFASPENKDFAESYGLRFTGTGVDLRDQVHSSADEAIDLESEDTKERIEAFKKDPGSFGGEAVDDLYKPEVHAEIARTTLDALEEAERNEDLPDAIFFHGLSGYAAYLAHHKFNVPIFLLSYCWDVFDGDDVRLLWAEAIKQNEGQKMLNEFGVSFLADAPAEEMARWKGEHTICCTSRLIVYLNEEMSKLPWEVHEMFKSRFTGPCVMDTASQMVDLGYFGGQETLKRLQDFLDAGSKPAYVGWGSMPMMIGTLAKVLLNMKIVKLRVVVVGGWAGFTQERVLEWIAETVPDDMFGLGDFVREQVCIVPVAPHEWLFQRCCFTVHHGGAGTTQAALRAGVPTIIMPFSFDQFAYGDWTANLGCGQKLLFTDNVDKMMDPAWSKAFRKASGGDKGMVEKAKEVGEEIRKERGTYAVLDRIKEGIERRQRGEGLSFGG